MSIEIRGLTHIYMPGPPFETRALDNVSLTIRDGEFVGVIGHTGSGKSTLIAHLNALIRPEPGHVFVGGVDVGEKGQSLIEIRREVGLVFQYPEYQLFEETVYKDIAFGPVNMGLSPAQVDERVREAANFVGLRDYHLQKSPFELSGGQKRRVAIAGVLAMNPDILVLDEPTAGLDPKGRDSILGQIKRYHRERGNTVLLVSHSMEDIARYARKVLVLNRSGVAMYDDVAKVFSRAEEITRMGLSVPQVTRIFMGLREEGFPVSESVYTMDYAREELLSLLGKGAGNHA